MKTVEVSASKNYQVIIGAGLLDILGQEVAKVSKAKKICVVTDSNVAPLYLETAKKSLAAAGFFDVCDFIIPAGEASKNGQTFLNLLNFLAESQLSRTDCLIALGGGVVGDLTGFAAAAYLRGIDYIQVPTTLLAAVDSSVGGKTAIDLPAGKNLAGAFYQPRLVLCDISALDTLPDEIFRDGCAEVIKYGVLYDRDLFAHLKEYSLSFSQEAVIARCVELKRDVVNQDEFDRGARQKLNLGHTIGHGVEAQSHFSVSHGKAVAIGMAIISRAGASFGICAPETRDAVLDLLEKFGLPVKTDYSAEALYISALSDKKRSGGTVNLIVPESIGHCIICPTPVETLADFIQAGL